MGFFLQTKTLTSKNILIALVRHPFSTPFRAFLLPIAFVFFLSFAKNIFKPPSYYGIGASHAVRTLEEAIDAASGGRKKLVIVDNGFTNGPISNVITSLVQSVDKSVGKVLTIHNESSLPDICHSTVRGVSNCFGAIIFHSSPSEGPGGLWNYTMKSDWALGTSLYIDRDDNDAEIFSIPLQHAVDFAIANNNITINQYEVSQVQNKVQEYTYTSLTDVERITQIRVKFMATVINIVGVAFLVAFVGITFHLTGFQAGERELEMSNLIEAMMPNERRWEPQVARLLSYHAAFSMIYTPSWIIMAIILSFTVFTQTSMAILILFHLTAGLALASFSILGAAFFTKAQLSGIAMTIVTILLGVIAQVSGFTSSASVAILSLLFSPCAYVFSIIFIARFERQDVPTDLLRAAPQSPWTLPGISLWMCLVVQIFLYPVLAAMVETRLYGAASNGRVMEDMPADALETVRLEHFKKEYTQTWLQKRMFLGGSDPFPANHKTVVAVNDLSFTARKGQILVLLGANGSGKSTTLDCIAGLNRVTSGKITVDRRGGIGIAPQKNVLWNELTVQEHVQIFNSLKCSGARASDAEIRKLINAVDLSRKADAKSVTLSGGQKRKLQMAMMFTGGSSVCCVDEVSSGLDPISRRKIWDILLAERGKRTILMTTHFLDEADLLADKLVVLSKGTLRAEGSTVELKSKLGGGYRVRLPPGETSDLDFRGFEKRMAFDHVAYLADDSTQAAELVGLLEDSGIDEYTLEGPTIEDVFLQLAEEIDLEEASQNLLIDQAPNQNPGLTHEKTIEKDLSGVVNAVTNIEASESGGLNLISGTAISFPLQAWILILKRVTILRRNYLPFIAAILLPVLAAALVTLFLDKNQTLPSCAPGVSITVSPPENMIDQPNYNLLVGPPSVMAISTQSLFIPLLPPELALALLNQPQPQKNLTIVDTLAKFNNYITGHYAEVAPGAVFAGSSPTFAWKGNSYDIYSSIFAQNALDVALTNISISTQFTSFDLPFTPNTGKSLQLVIYFCLAMAAYPAFFALYPTIERLRGIRGLAYSNGVSALPLWLAYIAFDWTFVLVASAIAIVVFVAMSSVWYHAGFLFTVFILYGMTSILLSYVVSLFAKTQLSAFAFAAAGQAVSFLIYLVSYLLTLTYERIDVIDSTLLHLHYTLSVIFPIGNLARSMFEALNLFSTTCVGREIAPHPAGLNQYGAPIIYLILQIILLVCFLLWWDTGSMESFYNRLRAPRKTLQDPSNSNIPLQRAQEPEVHSGLVVDHVTKTFKTFTAVNNVTFSVPPNQVFALLGPNGAGKSTTISMIRGDVQPDPCSGDIYIESIPMNRHRTAARRHLGVCPQHDAIDTMTVLEHLQFYARVRGIPDPNYNVRQIVKAVGLERFQTRLAMQLSGGNKRKLSLGIALMGNPSVLLLDEPSSGMDAASKRVMWRALKKVAPGRSILLTTHSMEEADALANRAGIVAGRVLAMGNLDSLRERFGQRYFVHCVAKSAPHTSEKEMNRLKKWVGIAFGDRDEGVEIEDKTYHGQMRFSVPIGLTVSFTRGSRESFAVPPMSAKSLQSLPRLKSLPSLPKFGEVHPALRSATTANSSIYFQDEHDDENDLEELAEDGEEEQSPFHRLEYEYYDPDQLHPLHLNPKTSNTSTTPPSNSEEKLPITILTAPPSAHFTVSRQPLPPSSQSHPPNHRISASPEESPPPPHFLTTTIAQDQDALLQSPPLTTEETHLSEAQTLFGEPQPQDTTIPLPPPLLHPQQPQNQV